MEIITSLDNTSVKQARSLKEKKYRNYYGLFLVEGRKQVSEAIQKGLNIDKVFVDSKKAKQFEDLIYATEAPILAVTEAVFKSISSTETPQGIIATVEMPASKLYKYRVGDKLLVLDKISDPGNMGTIIRTAAACGFNQIFTIDCVDAYSPKVVRSSSGGLYNVNLYPTDYAEVVNVCKGNSIELLIADMHGENIFGDFEIRGDYAIVIGNEGNGVSDNLTQYGRLIKVPMKQGLESLNAGVSASIIMYQLEGKNI